MGNPSFQPRIGPLHCVITLNVRIFNHQHIITSKLQIPTLHAALEILSSLSTTQSIKMVKAGKLQITTRQTGSLHMFAVTSSGCSYPSPTAKSPMLWYNNCQRELFLLTLSSTPSRRPSRRLESLWDSHLRAELRGLPHDHHLRHYRQRPQCRTRDSCPPVRRQHQWLHIGWSSLYVIPSNSPRGMARITWY